MHYYQFNVGNYRRKTIHLSLLEHGIYRSLLDTYYLNESPLCADLKKLMRTHNVRSSEEIEAFSNVIDDFFEKTDDGFVNSDCDDVINKYKNKSEKAKKSAEIRWGNANASKINANACETQYESNANHKPITNNQEQLNISKRFAEFWGELPKKIGKKDCEKIWKKRKLDNIADKIISDIKNRKLHDRSWLDGFIPNPKTYLNGDRWEDEIQKNEVIKNEAVVRNLSAPERIRAANKKRQLERDAEERENQKIVNI